MLNYYYLYIEIFVSMPLPKLLPLRGVPFAFFPDQLNFLILTPRKLSPLQNKHVPSYLALNFPHFILSLTHRMFEIEKMVVVNTHFTADVIEIQ